MRLGNFRVDDIDGFATLLKQAGVDFGAEDIADALWLAGHMGDLSGVRRGEQEQPTTSAQSKAGIREELADSDQTNDDRRAQLSLPTRSPQTKGKAQSGSGISIKAPAAPALRIRLDLARALRPLRRRVPSPGKVEFDEAATVEQIADQGIWSPVLQPAPERWLDVALVVEDMRSLPLWQATIAEFQTLLERQGAFRRVTTWRLQTEEGLDPKLFPNWRNSPNQQRPNRQRPQRQSQLWDAAGRRLILLLSDCTSEAWYNGSMVSWLKTCGQEAPTAIVQLLPERLWSQSALGQGALVWLRSLEPGTVSDKLAFTHRMPLLQSLLATPPPQPTHQMTVPVVTLEAEPLKQWARMVAGSGESRAVGIQFALDTFALDTFALDTVDREPEEENREEKKGLQQNEVELSAEERVQRFKTTASLKALELAGLMSAAPVSPPIVDLIRQTLLPKAEPVHVAEVFMGGLMQAQATPEGKTEEKPSLQYDFAPGVRNILADAVSRTKTETVLDAVSRYISERLGLSTKNFEALLRIDFQGDPTAQEIVVPFAEIAAQTLERMGGEYAAIAAQLATAPKIPPPPPPPDLNDLFPLLQTFTFREAILEFSPPEPLGPELHGFEFETVSLQVQAPSSELVLQRQQGRGQQLIEALGNEVELEMVLIPAGTFVMGAPETEKGRSDDEGPLHEVTFAKPFLMAKYPITQAQWRVVATLPQVERELDPAPSSFEGDHRPVEQISWHDAVEFCARLQRLTGRDYRLPTEAEWEYACRARTTTPFHFGETITTDLANYDGNYTFGGGPTGEYRQEPTEVGSFPANAFGLHDMHGNVWEWCQDDWHDDYTGAPADGSVWFSSDEGKSKVLRGGSWDDNPESCRSALRFWGAPDYRSDYLGLRVACGFART